MREILFKAKSISNGEWVEGAYLHQTDYYGEKCDKHYIIDGTETDMEGYGEHYLIDKDTLCQYTGLTDKNGNKIWENDIIKEFNSQGNEWNLSKVVFANHSLNVGWCVEGIKTLHVSNRRLFNVGLDLKTAQTSEVIGNIFDNPELIGGGE